MSDRERGSVLLLAPAGFLIVVLLGAVAVDLGVAFLRQREAYNLALDAANDAAAAGLREDAARSGTLVLDPGRVSTVVAETVAASGLGGVRSVRSTTTAAGGVVVTLVVDVPHVFAPAIPGVDPVEQVEVRAEVVGEERAPG